MRKLVVLALLLTCSATFAQERFGNWTVHRSTDRLTDRDTSMIIASVKEAPRFAGDAMLAVGCTQAATVGVSAVFHADQFLGSGNLRVLYRLDRQEAVEMTWRVTGGGQAVIVPDEHLPTFFRGLHSAREMVIRIHTSTTSETYALDVSGFRNALTTKGCYTGPPI